MQVDLALSEMQRPSLGAVRGIELAAAHAQDLRVETDGLGDVAHSEHQMIKRPHAALDFKLVRPRCSCNRSVAG